MKERASSPEEIAGSRRRLIAVLGVQTRDFFAKNDGKGTLGRKSLGKCWRQGDGSSWEEIHIEGLPRGFWGWAVRRDFRSIRRGGCMGGLAGDGSSLSFLEQTRLTSPSCLPSQSWRFPKIVEDRKGNFRNVRRQIGLGGGWWHMAPRWKWWEDAYSTLRIAWEHLAWSQRVPGAKNGMKPPHEQSWEKEWYLCHDRGRLAAPVCRGDMGLKFFIYMCLVLCNY